MEIQRKINLDVKKLVEKSVGKNTDFHFYVDELTSENFMPTYAGMADEKYAFEEMDDDFFNFLEEKRKGDGIFIRLIFAHGVNRPNGAEFKLEYCGKECEFKTNDLNDIHVFEFAEFGVKVQGDTVTFGAGAEGKSSADHFFARFGQDNSNGAFLSLENPLNRCVIKIIEEILNQL